MQIRLRQSWLYLVLKWKSYSQFCFLSSLHRNGELVEIDPAQVFELGQATTSIPQGRLPVPIVAPAEEDSGTPSKKLKRKRPSTKLLAKAIKFQSQARETRDAMDAFYESCSLRTKQLPKSKQGWLQMQVSMLLYAAESGENVPTHGHHLCFQPHWSEQGNGDGSTVPEASANVQLDGTENQDWQN